MLGKMPTLPELADASTDLLANAPQLKVTINRDHASRFGISPQLIADTLDDAYGQRQVTQYLTQLDANPIILEIKPELLGELSSLDRIYVKSPLTGGRCRCWRSRPSPRARSVPRSRQGPVPGGRAGFNLRPGAALGQAVDSAQAARPRMRAPSSGRSGRRGVPGLAVSTPA